MSLSHRELVRRVVILCCSFTRNVAYYRAGWADEAQPLLSERNPAEVAFWRQMNSNSLDTAVLDWCKLFHRQSKHHWRKVVSVPEDFKRRLLAQLDTNEDGLAALIDKMREYRDKFVAHLDNKLVMDIPELSEAHTAVTFYHRYIVEHEAKPEELVGLPNVQQFALAYDQSIHEAAQIYAAAIDWLHGRRSLIAQSGQR